MKASKNLPDNLEELGALQSLLPKSLLLERTARLEADLKREGRSKSGAWRRPPQTLETIRLRFMANVIKNDSGCWVWSGQRKYNGYGMFYCLVKKHLAHRISWIINNGIIPDGLCVLHHCDNPPCVNPAHLFLGTQQDNSDDMGSKGRRRALRGEDRPQCKLTKEDVMKIRERRRLGERIVSIHKDYPFVVCGTIANVTNRLIWKWIP